MRLLKAGFLLMVIMHGMIFAAVETPGKSYSLGGILFKVPESWKPRVSVPTLRELRFEIPSGADGTLDFSAFYAGRGLRDETAIHVAHWRSQFVGPPVGFVPEIENGEVNGIKVTTVHFQGSYLGKKAGGSLKKDYAMFGAVIEAAHGPVFFSMTGPRDSLLKFRGEFNSLLRTVEPVKAPGKKQPS